MSLCVAGRGRPWRLLWCPLGGPSQVWRVQSPAAARARRSLSSPLPGEHSAILRLYRSHIVAILWSYISHIMAILWSYRSHIVAILWSYRSHIVAILSYISHIVIILWPPWWSYSQFCGHFVLPNSDFLRIFCCDTALPVV